MYSFKDLVAAGLIPDPNEQQAYLAYRAQKRRRTMGVGEGGPIGESIELAEGETEAVAELEKNIVKLKVINYDSVDRLMRMIAKDHGITPKELHHAFKDKHDMIPDDWAKSKIQESNEQLDEVLDPMQRMKRKQLMRRLKSRLKIGRERSKRKTADLSKLKNRAQKRARLAMFKKLAQGRGKEEMSYADRKQVEKRLDAKKGMIDRMAKKLLPQVRKDEQARKQMVGKK